MSVWVGGRACGGAEWWSGRKGKQRVGRSDSDSEAVRSRLEATHEGRRCYVAAQTQTLVCVLEGLGAAAALPRHLRCFVCLQVVTSVSPSFPLVPCRRCYGSELVKSRTQIPALRRSDVRRPRRVQCCNCTCDCTFANLAVCRPCLVHRCAACSLNVPVSPVRVFCCRISSTDWQHRTLSRLHFGVPSSRTISSFPLSLLLQDCMASCRLTTVATTPSPSW